MTCGHVAISSFDLAFSWEESGVLTCSSIPILPPRTHPPQINGQDVIARFLRTPSASCPARPPSLPLSFLLPSFLLLAASSSPRPPCLILPDLFLPPSLVPSPLFPCPGAEPWRLLASSFLVTVFSWELFPWPGASLPTQCLQVGTWPNPLGASM